MKLKLSLLVGSGIVALLTGVGISYVAQQNQTFPTNFRANSSVNSTVAASGPSTAASVIQSQSCITLVSDSQPPLNVRSSPIVASNNVVGQLTNGTRLTVAAEQGEWLQVEAPIAGWVYKTLTLTSCPTANGVPASRPASTATNSEQPIDAGPTLLATATEQYQAGNLEVATALANAVPKTSLAYAEAQLAIAQWQQDWQLAKTRFQVAQTAFQEQRWQDVLGQVKGFPEIRFWKEKLTPVVKASIEQQGSTGQNYDNKTQPILLADHRPATVAGRFASSGVHQYLLDGVQGQVLTIDTGGLGPLPVIMAPDGTLLGTGSDRSTRWIGKLPLNGTYKLKLDSRSQPYDYAFSVQLN
jgi:uncharacterized protein YgiM (DUF1202 family)